MFGKNAEDWQQFHDLTEIMENAGDRQPPDDFTTKVMARLSKEKEPAQSFSLRRLFPTNLNFGFHEAVTKTECAFYFFLTGFFYFILGLMMLAGFPPGSIMRSSGWISFQPVLGLFIAAGLISLGVAIYKNNNISIHVVQVGTLLYTVLIILNGCMGAFFVHVPVAAFFDVIFSIAGLGTAFLLGLAVDHYRSEIISSEVRG